MLAPNWLRLRRGEVDALAGDGVVGLRERVVAVELPQRAVKLIAAALGDHVDLAAGRAAGLGRVGAGLAP